MIVMTINAFMKLPEKERIEVLRKVAKGDMRIVEFEQMLLEVTA